MMIDSKLVSFFLLLLSLSASLVECGGSRGGLSRWSLCVKHEHKSIRGQGREHEGNCASISRRNIIKGLRLILSLYSIRSELCSTLDPLSLHTVNVSTSGRSDEGG